MMNNEIEILIVGTGENSIQFKVGEPAFWNYEMRNENRRVIEVIKVKNKVLGKSGYWAEGWVYVGYDKNERQLFEVPVESCVVIYKAALEVVDE